MEKAKKICELKLNETEAVVGGAVSIATMPVSRPAGTTTQARY